MVRVELTMASGDPQKSRIITDFADPAQDSAYPAHGWATNSQGVKLLWVPIRRIALGVAAYREAKGVSNIKHTRSGDANSLFRALMSLALSLRELGRCERTIGEADTALGQRRILDEAATYIDLSFTYAHRVADRLARALGPFLYEKPGSLNGNFSQLRKSVVDGKVHAGAPLVNSGQLARIFSHYTVWYDTLRGPRGQGGIKRGIRDLLEHEPGQLMTGGHQTNNDPITITARYVAPQYGQGNIEEWMSPELIPLLRETIAGMVSFLDRVAILLGASGSYQRGDWFYLEGEDTDIVSFWPQLP